MTHIVWMSHGQAGNLKLLRRHNDAAALVSVSLGKKGVDGIPLFHGGQAFQDDEEPLLLDIPQELVEEMARPGLLHLLHRYDFFLL